MPSRCIPYFWIPILESILCPFTRMSVTYSGIRLGHPSFPPSMPPNPSTRKEIDYSLTALNPC